MSDTSTQRRPGVGQTTSLLFDNQPTWGDLFWLVDKAREAGVPPEEELMFEWDDDNPAGGHTALSFVTHPETRPSGQGHQ